MERSLICTPAVTVSAEVRSQSVDVHEYYKCLISDL